jgi:hypothetical protein
MISDNKSKRIPHAMLMEKINDIERSGLWCLTKFSQHSPHW